MPTACRYSAYDTEMVNLRQGESGNVTWWDVALVFPITSGYNTGLCPGNWRRRIAAL